MQNGSEGNHTFRRILAGHSREDCMVLDGTEPSLIRLGLTLLATWRSIVSKRASVDQVLKTGTTDLGAHPETWSDHTHHRRQ